MLVAPVESVATLVDSMRESIHALSCVDRRGSGGKPGAIMHICFFSSFTAYLLNTVVSG